MLPAQHTEWGLARGQTCGWGAVSRRNSPSSQHRTTAAGSLATWNDTCEKQVEAAPLQGREVTEKRGWEGRGTWRFRGRTQTPSPHSRLQQKVLHQPLHISWALNGLELRGQPPVRQDEAQAIERKRLLKDMRG